MDHRESHLEFEPAVFALDAYPEDDDAPVVVAWGMSLPDGTVVAVGWCDDSRGAIACCRAAESAAFLFDADVCWIRSAA